MNDNEYGDFGARDAIEEQAISWFIRLRRQDDASLKHEFDAWIAASPAHAEAYRRVERNFANAGIVRNSRHMPRWRRAAPNRWALAAAVAAAAAIAGVALRPDLVGIGPPGTKVMAGTPLATRHGEIHTYRLSDGSDVTLDSDSRVEVAMSEVERRVKLRKGNARFAVATDPRPFVVEAGAGAIRANQAVFDVSSSPQRVIQVRLLSGTADIRSNLQPAVFTVTTKPLPTGAPVRYSATDYGPETVSDSSIDRKDWPSGWVEYRSIALRDLVAEANRYAGRPILIDGDDVGDLTVSGRFKLTDTASFVSRIAELFDLKIERRPDGIHLRRK